MNLTEPVSLPFPWQISIPEEKTPAQPSHAKRWEPLLEPPLADRLSSARCSLTWRRVAYAVTIVAITLCFAGMGTMGTTAFVLLSHPLLLPLTIPVAIGALIGLFFCSERALEAISSRFKTPLAEAKQRVKQAELLLTKYNQTPSDTAGLKNYITTNSLLSSPEEADQILQKFDKNLDKLRIAIAHYLRAKEGSSEGAENDSFRGAAHHLEAAFWLVMIRRGGEPLPRKEGKIDFVESPLLAPSGSSQPPLPFARIGQTDYATAEDVLNKSITELTEKIGVSITAA